MPILDNKQVILSYGGGGVSPLNVNITPNSLSGNQNSTLISFTESGTDLSSVSKRIYTFGNESVSQSSNPSYTFTTPGNKTISAYFYSDSMDKVGYAESNVTIYQPSGYTCDLIANCDICAALTKEASAYTGPLVKLLRESDWQTADIPYNSFETLDTVSATTFLNLPIDDNLTGLPLDIMSSTKSLGYSTFRKIRTSYTGNCMTIRRSSDNATLNVGFGNDNYIVTSAITNFLSGGTTGFCTTLFNQGTLGSAADFVQVNLINQPIVDISSFAYPVLDVSPRNSIPVFMPVRTQATLTANYTSISKLNLFFKLRAKSTQTAIAQIVPLNFENGNYLSLTTNNNATTNLQGCFYTSGVLSGGYSAYPNHSFVSGWTCNTVRGRMDSSIYDRRYLMIGINNYDVQQNISNSSTYKSITVNFSITNFTLNFQALVNDLNGWISELLLDDTDLTHNQFYKIKKNVSSTFENIPYSAKTNTGLRVMKIYNQKSSTGGDYIQNCVSNMPDFIINDTVYNRPSIFSKNTYNGDILDYEPRMSNMLFNDNEINYNNQFSFVSLYVPTTGNTNNNQVKNSNNSGASRFYHNRLNTNGNLQIIYQNVNYNNLIESPYINRSVPTLSIDSYRQEVKNGFRRFSYGISGYTASTVPSSGSIIVSTRSTIFNQANSATNAFRGNMFFDMSFGSIPSNTDWNNLIYPLLKNKYGALD